MSDFERETEDYSSDTITLNALNQLLQEVLRKNRQKIKTVNHLSLEITTKLLLKEKEMIEGYNSMKG